jgi:hypothetical protein
MAKLQTSSIAELKAKIKFIRPFVNGFGLRQIDLRKLTQFSDLSYYQRKQIEKYYKGIRALTTGVTYVYRPRRKDHLHSVQRATQTPEDLPALKVAFIQSVAVRGKNNKLRVLRPTISFRSDGIANIDIGPIRRITLYFSDFGITKDEVLDDAGEAINRLIEEAGLEGKRYRILAGEYEVRRIEGRRIPRVLRQKDLADYVNKLMELYGSGDYDEDDKNSHYWGNWLLGVKVYLFSNIKQQDTYLQEEEAYYQEKKDINNEIRKVRIKLKDLERRRKDIKLLDIDKRTKIKAIHSIDKEAYKFNTLLTELLNKRAMLFK